MIGVLQNLWCIGAHCRGWTEGEQLRRCRTVAEVLQEWVGRDGVRRRLRMVGRAHYGYEGRRVEGIAAC